LSVPQLCSSRLPNPCQPLYNARSADVAQLVEQHIRKFGKFLFILAFSKNPA
jgi:hypothetical protein